MCVDEFLSSVALSSADQELKSAIAKERQQHAENMTAN